MKFFILSQFFMFTNIYSYLQTYLQNGMENFDFKKIINLKNYKDEISEF